MKIIGLCGPEGAGKSTVARIIAKRRAGVAIVPFAAPLKRMIHSLGVPHDCVYGDATAKAQPLDLLCGKTAREAMQTLGTQWGRQLIGDDFWLRAWRHAVDNSGGQIVVADDVRFANEACEILQAGGKVLCVVRSLEDYRRQPKHASEDFAAVPATHRVINNGTISDLIERVDAFLDGRVPAILSAA